MASRALLHVFIVLLLIQWSIGQPESSAEQAEVNENIESPSEEKLVDEIKQKLQQGEPSKHADQLLDATKSIANVIGGEKTTQSNTNESAKDKSNRSSEQENNDAIKYQVSWLPKLKNREEAEKDGRLFQIAITATDKYTCISPKMQSRDEVLRQTLYENRHINPVRLMEKVITPEHCVMRLDHYWTYMICHGRHLTQFHEDSKGKVDSQVYVLGKYNEAEMIRTRDQFQQHVEHLWLNKELPVPTVNVHGRHLPYVEWTLTDGQICDLNQKPRSTLIKYVCSLNDKKEFLSLKEVATCQYEAIVALPHLCLNPAFGEIDKAQIECAPDSEETGQYPPNYFQYHKNEALAHVDIFDSKRLVFANGDLKNNFKFQFKTVSVDETEDGTYVVKFDEHDEEPTVISLQPKEAAAKKPKAVHAKMMENFLRGQMCFTGGSGWWRYEFCYGKHVKQYHEENGKKGATIVLGKWDVNRHRQQLTDNPAKQQPNEPNRNHIVHHYTQGDYCESIKGPRSTDVKLKCQEATGEMGSESVQLYLIESKTCEYQLVFISPLVCDLIRDADQFGLVDDKLPSIKH